MLELLDAGIDVHTTINVQHVESLGDVIQQITGVRVRETVPDALIERADEIELVDISPDELLERLAEGKVYVPEQAQRAVQNFFHKGNLHALRELALRRTAERVDAEVLAYRKEKGISETWPTAERILVCVGPSPGSERLIRATKRIAEGLHAEWSAAHVEVLGAPPLSEKDRDRVEAHLRLVESLGGEVVRLAGRTVAARAARARAQDQRHPDRRRQADPPALARPPARQPARLADPRLGDDRGPRDRAGRSGPAAAGLADPSGARDRGVVRLGGAGDRDRDGRSASLLADYVTIAEITMLYLIAITLASLAGRGPSLLAASLAVAAFDFCFVPPKYTFAVTDLRYLMTFAVMFAAGFVISTLTTRLRGQERDALDPRAPHRGAARVHARHLVGDPARRRRRGDRRASRGVVPGVGGGARARSRGAGRARRRGGPDAARAAGARRGALGVRAQADGRARAPTRCRARASSRCRWSPATTRSA